MFFGKFLLNFIAAFIGLLIIVWLGTAFDNSMTFTWYSYTICSVLGAFYAFTKSVNMNKIEPQDATPAPACHHHPHHHSHIDSNSALKR